MSLFVAVRLRHSARPPCGVIRVVSLAVLFAWAAPASAQVASPRPLGADLPVFRPGTAAEPRPIANPTGQVTLRDALAVALLQSPELAAYAWEIRARESRTLQAGRAPNPVFSTVVEDL